MLRPIIRIAAYIWASPYTAIGLLIGVAFGGKPQLVSGVFEIHSPRIAWLLTHLPVRAAAMTMGHVVLGQTPLHLQRTRLHERVHVRQFERWGPLFIPAYLACSLWLWVRGRDAYRGNPFECEAYEHDRLCALGEMDRKAPEIIA